MVLPHTSTFIAPQRDFCSGWVGGRGEEDTEYPVPHEMQLSV